MADAFQVSKQSMLDLLKKKIQVFAFVFVGRMVGYFPS